MARHGRRAAFTLIELLTVIAIIMLVMALALPDFVAMMRGRKWSTATANVQAMVMRARALATNVRMDMSVEFGISGDNGTMMWLESESNVVETLEDLNVLYARLGGGGSGYLALDYLANSSSGVWYAAGGRRIGNESSARFEYHPELTNPAKFGDNARQSEAQKLSPYITINPSAAASPNFVSWDTAILPDGARRLYGADEYKDIRIGSHGALVQTREPVICLKAIGSNERLPVTVVRCTGRVLRVR